MLHVHRSHLLLVGMTGREELLYFMTVVHSKFLITMPLVPKRIVILKSRHMKYVMLHCVENSATLM